MKLVSVSDGKVQITTLILSDEEPCLLPPSKNNIFDIIVKKNCAKQGIFLLLSVVTLWFRKTNSPVKHRFMLQNFRLPTKLRCKNPQFLSNFTVFAFQETPWGKNYHFFIIRLAKHPILNVTYYSQFLPPGWKNPGWHGNKSNSSQQKRVKSLQAQIIFTLGFYPSQSKSKMNHSRSLFGICRSVHRLPEKS